MPRSQVKTSKQRLVAAATQTTPEDVPIQSSSVHPDYANHNDFAMHGPTLQFSTHSASLPSLHHLGNTGPAQSTFSPPRLTPYPTNRYFPAKLESDNVSQTSRLLVEIATLKKENEEVRTRYVGDFSHLFINLLLSSQSKKGNVVVM